MVSSGRDWETVRLCFKKQARKQENQLVSSTGRIIYVARSLDLSVIPRIDTEGKHIPSLVL